MERNEEMSQQHESGECCSSDLGSLKSLKTAIFILVIIAACALAAHSVLSNGTGSPCGSGAAGLCPLNKSCATGGTCTLKETSADNTGCSIKEKANPSSCCPGTETPACCPNAGTPDCGANTETPSSCPTMENPGGCPKATAVTGCCPSLKSE